MTRASFVTRAVLAGALALLGAGCSVQGGAYAATTYPEPLPIAFSSPPALVHVDSDVWVVYDYRYPV